MGKQYIHHTVVTKETLDTVKIGDLIKVNNWKRPMKVVGVSKNYFVMMQKMFNSTYYSVVSKNPWDGVIYNSLVGGHPYCGPDNFLFGCPLSIKFNKLYNFDNDTAINEYLQKFEDGEYEISERKGVAIFDIYIKGGTLTNALS